MIDLKVMGQLPRQIQCAIKNGCDVFVTEDKGIHGRSYGMDVMGLDDVVRFKI